MPFRLLLVLQINIVGSRLLFTPPKSCTCPTTLLYHARAASFSPYTVFFSLHILSVFYSYSGFRYTSLSILFPCKYAVLTSMDFTIHPSCNIFAIHSFRVSGKQVGASVSSCLLYYSKPPCYQPHLTHNFSPFHFSLSSTSSFLIGSPLK